MKGRKIREENEGMKKIITKRTCVYKRKKESYKNRKVIMEQRKEEADNKKE